MWRHLQRVRSHKIDLEQTFMSDGLLVNYLLIKDKVTDAAISSN